MDSAEAVSDATKTVWDWSKAYERWEVFDAGEDGPSKPKDFEDVLKAEAEKAGGGGPDGMGHYHDHSEERAFFEKPEDEKMRYCEKHRVYGNALYEEGMLPKAAEQYQLTLSYYEYCFPETTEEQNHLDELRHACLCNASLCYYRVGEMRKAIACATQVLDKNPLYVKALYRRARAYRELDEYSNALEDLNAALSQSPKDASLQKELQLLIRQKESAKEMEQDIAQKMMSGPTSYADLMADTTPQTPRLGASNSKSSRSITPQEDAGVGKSCLYDSHMPIEAFLPKVVADLLQPELNSN